MSEELVLHTTGEVVNLADETQCAHALRHLRDVKAEIDSAIRVLSGALAEAAERHATKTLHLNTATVVIKGGSQTLYDADAIERGLLEAGMPDYRVAQIVKEEVTVTRRVVAAEAQKAAKMNDAYRAVIEQHSTVVEKPAQVTVT